MSADLLKLLLELTLAGSAAIIMVLLLRVPMRKLFGAMVAYAIWGLIPLAMLAVVIPAPEVVVTVVTQAANDATVSALVPAAMLAPTRDITPDLYLAIWLIGALACVFWFFRQQKMFLDALGALSHSYENIFLAQNNHQGPAVIGVLQPRIVLPCDFDQRYNPEEQKLVLTHELSHVASGDTRVNFIAMVLRCVFWFNPLLHWADGRFRFDQELSTDAKVLSQFPSSRKSYADAMLKTQMASTGLPAACHWQANHPLKERILMLKKTAPGKWVRVLGFSIVTLLGLTGAFAAWSNQPANIILTSAEAGLLYEIKIDAMIDRVKQKPITLREVPGKTFAVVQGEGAQAWSYEFSLTRIDDQFSIIKGKVKHGETLMSEPNFKIPNGKNSVISINTKDHSSDIVLNLVASLMRNGKTVPVAAYNGDHGVANGAYLMQSGDGTQKIYTRTDLENPIPVANTNSIKTPAKLIPTAEFTALQAAGKNTGQAAIQGLVHVDAKGNMVSAAFEATLPATEATRLSDLIGAQKFEAAVAFDGKAVASKLAVEVYLDSGKH